ncbi:MAG: AAA family ATPase [Proteobacteria bacterium]|nr:AAA family ATPase [Pseudomonadota bacterium]
MMNMIHRFILGLIRGFYDEILSFFRNFYIASFRDNPCLFKAVLKGILNVERESLFPDFNRSLEISSVLSSKFSSCFGFTESEIEELLNQAHHIEKMKEIKDWYEGYHMNHTVVYSPWSMVNFIQKEWELRPYWVDRADSGLIKTLFADSPPSFKDEIADLLQGKRVEEMIDENVGFSEVNTPLLIRSLFLKTGYLTALHYLYLLGAPLCQLAIPNKEVSFLFQRIIEGWFVQNYGLEWYQQFLNSLLTGDIEKFSAELKELMDHTVSIHDTGRSPEAFYHGLMIGLTASLHGSPLYEIRSNRERGSGRYDYAIIAREPQTLSILMDFKRVQEGEDKTLSPLEREDLLKQTAEEALIQITQKAYYAEIQQRGLTRLLKIGLAFSGKKFCLVHEICE